MAFRCRLPDYTGERISGLGGKANGRKARQDGRPQQDNAAAKRCRSPVIVLHIAILANQFALTQAGRRQEQILLPTKPSVQ
jgi:hypothetical protein